MIKISLSIIMMSLVLIKIKKVQYVLLLNEWQQHHNVRYML